ncbi:hypothetical protein [Pseudomonas sp. MONT-RG-20F-20-E-7-02]|uniref:hypothetical protein n=1 Tax=Pseudomonas sp. MONT-RG-20F-20-E-7-02 TaxID=2914979 RepID=UPI001F5AE204|nr:hypothetical protein [Pseudomonas sp. MONT-RG-20F-20-E-7-02]
MSEVMKFKCIGNMVGRSRLGGAEYVFLSDFDRVNAERDAALGREAELRESIVEFRDREVSLRESLGKARHRLGEVLDERAALQQRLTAEDERVDQAVTALNEIARISRMSEEPFEIATRAIGEISALKPAEGGGDAS